MTGMASQTRITPKTPIFLLPPSGTRSVVPQSWDSYGTLPADAELFLL